MESCATVKNDYQELKTIHVASLILIGEREEQVELLSNDLAELKQVYKQHLAALSLDVDKLINEKRELESKLLGSSKTI